MSYLRIPGQADHDLKFHNYSCADTTPAQEKQNAATAIVHDWSNRFLTLSIAGILFLTLYPFDFARHSKPYSHSPLLLGHASSGGTTYVLLNILLFVPFGFALACKLLRTKRSKSALVYTVVTAALFSYLIELSQLYIPQRTSGWIDVFTNTTGAVMGFLVFVSLGFFVFRMLSRIEEFIGSRTTPGALALGLILYFGTWYVASLSVLGPGTVLASYFRHLGQTQLNGYIYIYYALVFFPAGALLGMVLTGRFARRFGAFGTAMASGLTVIAVPALLEWVTRRVSNSAFSTSNFGLSVAIVVFGFCWSKMDAAYRTKTRKSGLIFPRVGSCDT
jgi:VanZ family protein